MTTMDTSGFYKLDGNQVLFAPNYVLHSSLDLRRETKNTVPSAGGWRWYDDRVTAQAALGATDAQMEAVFPPPRADIATPANVRQ